MHFESVMMVPARMCLTGCAQTLVHIQPINRLSHLDPRLPVAHLVTAWCLRPGLGSAGFRCCWESQNRPRHMMLDKNGLSWKLLFMGFSNARPRFSETVLPLCLLGGFLIDLQPQLNTKAFMYCTWSPSLAAYSVKGHDLHQLSSRLVIRLLLHWIPCKQF